MASLLFGAAVGLSLPLAAPPPPFALAAGSAALAALLPVLVVALLPRVPARGHTAVGPAVRFLSERELSCANDCYAAELAKLNGVEKRRVTFRERRLSLALLPGLLVCPLLPLLVQGEVAPLVRVVNVTGETLGIELDGERVLLVEPTSVESPAAGGELSVPAGLHTLVARDPEGREIERERVEVRAGRPHLFAPASAGHCFWLETREYGRDAVTEVAREPLEGPPYFWALPQNLGGWFLPAPEATKSEARLTGGAVTVLRQGPCEN